MREGFGGAGQNTAEKGMFAQAIAEMTKMARETGGGESEQRFFLQKMMPGLSDEGTRTMVKIGEEIAGGKDINKVIADHQDELNKAYENRGKETSDFQKALLHIQNGIAQIGFGILQGIIASTVAIEAGVQWLGLKLSGSQDTEAIAYNEYKLGMSRDMATSGIKTGYSGIGELERGFKMAGVTTTSLGMRGAHDWYGTQEEWMAGTGREKDFGPKRSGGLASGGWGRAAITAGSAILPPIAPLLSAVGQVGAQDVLPMKDLQDEFNKQMLSEFMGGLKRANIGTEMIKRLREIYQELAKTSTGYELESKMQKEIGQMGLGEEEAAVKGAMSGTPGAVYKGGQVQVGGLKRPWDMVITLTPAPGATDQG
jgi:hypothetical protein